jgi:uncharacterized protein with HEPN domain
MRRPVPKNDLVYITHMLELAQKVQARVSGLDRAAFDADEDLRLALTHLVQTFGEAARRVSPEMQAQHPEVHWKLIVGMRHKIVHDYMTIDEDILWQVVSSQIGPVAATLRRIVPP